MTAKRKIIFVGLLLSGLFSNAHAFALPQETENCFNGAASRYNLPANLLKSIAYVESRFVPEAMNRGHLTRTSTVDVGMMQINSSWLKKLSKFGINYSGLKETCQNIFVGAWVLAHHMKESGGGWNGVAEYNASCRTLSRNSCFNARWDYTSKVWKALQHLEGERPVSMPTLLAENINVNDAGGSAFSKKSENKKIVEVVEKTRVKNKKHQFFEEEAEQLVTVRFD